MVDGGGVSFWNPLRAADKSGKEAAKGLLDGRAKVRS